MHQRQEVLIGCNFLVQLWAIEHFCQRANKVEIDRGIMGNQIINHPLMMTYLLSLNG